MDGSQPLNNPKHERFCLLVATGEYSAAEAYRKTVSKAGTAKTSHEEASKLAASPKARPRIRFLRSKAQEVASERAHGVVLSIAEKREFLARLVRCKVQTEPADSDLWNGIKATEHGAEYKLPCKIAAIKQDNDLAGDGEEAKANSALSGLAALVERLRR